ncbi:WASH complex, subunit strumpellin, partial [Kipferlia bialata]
LLGLSQLELRGKLAQLSQRVAVFTRGVLAMDSSLVGVIRVEPRELLETGIRRHLVRQISFKLNRELSFHQCAQEWPLTSPMDPLAVKDSLQSAAISVHNQFRANKASFVLVQVCL